MLLGARRRLCILEICSCRIGDQEALGRVREVRAGTRIFGGRELGSVGWSGMRTKSEMVQQVRADDRADIQRLMVGESWSCT